MTTAEFKAWLDANFPDHARRGRPPKDSSGRGIAAAAAFLGLSIRSVIRKRDGIQPIEPRDEIIINAHRPMPPQAGPRTRPRATSRG